MGKVGAAPTSSPADLRLSVRFSGATYEQSTVLLARAHLSGTMELLTSAWGKLLGYSGQDFAGKTFREFLRAGRPVDAVAALLDERSPEPLELKVCCRKGHIKNLRLHRRFDPQDGMVYFVAEETLEGGAPDKQLPDAASPA